MKTLNFIFGSATMLATFALSAQQTSPAPDESPVVVGRNVTGAQAMARIVRELDAGDEAAATADAAALCTSTDGSPFRHLELALRYLLLSQLSRAIGASQSAMNRFAELALAQTQMTSTTDNGIKAQGLQLAGLIYENCLGDRVTAKVSYAAALQADPASVRAQQELDRLNTEDAMASAQAILGAKQN